jgi:ribosomal protein S27AE
MTTVIQSGPATRPPPIRAHPVGRRLRKAGLAAFFASVGVNAVLGIVAVLSPDFGETQQKVLGTSLCVTGAVLLALACEPAWERGLLGLVPLAGAVLGTAGFALAIGGIWAEPAGDAYGRIQGSVLAYAAACVLASLLALAPLAPRRAWLPRITYGLLAVGATMFAALQWFEDEPPEWFLRPFGVVLIVLAALAVTIPVLHWIDRRALAAVGSTADEIRYCPYCGAEVRAEHDGEATCRRCGREFAVHAREAPAQRSSPDLT